MMPLEIINFNRMKENIKITESDYVRLCNLIQSQKYSKAHEINNLSALGNEIKRAIRVNPKKIPPKYVTMNSIVVIKDRDLNKLITVQLVYPGSADFRKGHISVLSPLGTALLGYKEGSLISFKVPGGTKNIEIYNIVYQPEANGDYTV
jgi:regulator of nucleoside diphosphate kinase